jgi:nucleoside-diphosphate-sugar epimerase
VGDVRDANLIERLVRNQDYVFHLAAQADRQAALENPRLNFDINAVGTLNVLEGCRRAAGDVRLVYAGSRAQVGEPLYLPVDCLHPEFPLDVYGASKLAGEKYALAYYHSYGMKTTSLRLSNVYGPRGQLSNSSYGVVNLFIGFALRGKPIPVYGDGTQTRDYVYVDDVTEAFIRAAETERALGECLMVGSGVETVFLDMVKMIASIAGGSYYHVPFPPDLASVDVHRFQANIDKTWKMISWVPKTGLEMGIRDTLKFYTSSLLKYPAPQ